MASNVLLAGVQQALNLASATAQINTILTQYGLSLPAVADQTNGQISAANVTALLNSVACKHGNSANYHSNHCRTDRDVRVVKRRPYWRRCGGRCHFGGDCRQMGALGFGRNQLSNHEWKLIMKFALKTNISTGRLIGVPVAAAA